MLKKSSISAAFLIAALVSVGCSNSGQLKSQIKASAQTSAIVGGQEVTAEDAIATSTVALYTSLNNRGSVCTGTLISHTLIVTAAHCLGAPGSEITVIFDLDMDNWSQANSRPVIAFAANARFARVNQLASVPPDKRDKADLAFLNESGWGDIAVLRFAGNLPPGYAPASILPDPRPLIDGTEITLAGFGRTDGSLTPMGGTGKLRRIEAPIAKVRYKRGEILVDQRNGGACRGDSGGPAYIKDKTGKYWLFGIISHSEGKNGANCTVLSAATNVIAYMSWLEKMAKTVLLVDGRKSLRGGKYIPIQVTEEDAAQVLAQR